MSWFLAILGFVLLIILHELGHFAAAKAVGMRVERFSLFFPPLLVRKKIGETEYAIGAIPAGGYVKISGMNPSEDLPDEVRTRAYYSQPVWKRIVVIAAGPFVNLVIGFVLLVVFAWLIGPQASIDKVGTVEKGFPAYGKLQAGDKLVAVDGHAGSVTQLGKLISSHKCSEQPPKAGCRAATPATVTVQRAGKRLTFRINPIYDASSAVHKTRLGFGFASKRDPFSFGGAVSAAGGAFGRIAKVEVTLPARIVNPQQRKQIHGIVGSYETTRQTILHDPGDVVQILAVISLALAIVNLFPFLPLDGGHIFWALVELIRRRPVPFSTMERSGVIGFALVIMLFAIGLTNDISTLSNGGFKVR